MLCVWLVMCKWLLFEGNGVGMEEQERADGCKRSKYKVSNDTVTLLRWRESRNASYRLRDQIKKKKRSIKNTMRYI